MGNDIFLGGIKFTPDFDNLNPMSEWHSLSGGIGKVQIKLSFQPSLVCDFIFSFLFIYLECEFEFGLIDFWGVIIL